MHVALWLPVHATMRPETGSSLYEAVDALRARGHRTELRVLGQESLLSRARNTIAARFLGSLADVLVGIDADVAFRPEDLEALLAHDVPVVSGDYATSTRAPVPRLGFCAVRRDALEDLIRARERDDAFPLEYYPYEDIPCVWGFYVPWVHGRRYLADDEAFAERLARAGVPAHVDRSIRVAHAGHPAMERP
jgi:hypothetical protein